MSLFGSGSGFGQQNNQQQQGTGFGGFGTTNNTTGTGRSIFALALSRNPRSAIAAPFVDSVDAWMIADWLRRAIVRLRSTSEHWVRHTSEHYHWRSFWE